MKMGRKVHDLLWLIRAEDSSSWDSRRRGEGTGSDNVRSIVKCLAWYMVALTVSIFVAKLH